MLAAIARGTAPGTHAEKVALYFPEFAWTTTVGEGNTVNTGSVSPNIKAPNAYSAGDLVTFANVGGVTGIVSERPYFVIGTPSGTEFQVSAKPGGAAQTWTGTFTAGGKVCKHKEVKAGEGGYARQTLNFGAGAIPLGVVEDTEAHEFKVPIITNGSSFLVYMDASAKILAISLSVEEFKAAGSYTVQNTKFDLLASA